MSSITYWNRVEPSPRSDSLVRGLEARVRDPLWFLARQWQTGEFRGEDAASPAYVSLAAAFTSFEGWRVTGGDLEPLDGTTPLEALVEDEASTPDWRTSVELGQALERRLSAAGAGDDTLAAFRTAFPVPRPADLGDDEARDHALVRFLRVCGGRAVDGLAALEAAEASAPAVPGDVTLPSGEDPGPIAAALAEYVSWTRAAYGAIGRDDAAAWRPERLDYSLEVVAATPAGTRDRLSADPGLHGAFDWFSLDVVGAEPGAPEGDPHEVQTSVFPTRVSFSGMPNSRWWQFEDARFNWQALDTDRRELAKTLVLDFMLVQADDWFVVPFGQPVGSVVRVDQVLVRDVFDEWTLVPRADATPQARRDGWSMFSITGSSEDEPLADYLALPPSALRATLDGPVLEEVRFLRDEQANMVWAVEATTENGVGRPWDGRERALELPEEPSPTPTSEAPLRYRLQTTTPVNWIPFVPAHADAEQRAVALQRAAMQRFAGGTIVSVAPVGRVLTPSGLADPAVYRVNEEEVERSGTRIDRAVRRVRWLGGETLVWTSRRRRPGLGEGVSGLAYDLAERTEQPGST